MWSLWTFVRYIICTQITERALTWVVPQEPTLLLASSNTRSSENACPAAHSHYFSAVQSLRTESQQHESQPHESAIGKSVVKSKLMQGTCCQRLC